MSSEVNNISAELRREKELWKLGPDCPKEGLMAHALFDHLVYSNEINALDEQGRERKEQLELRKSQIEDEMQNDSQGLKTSLQQQLEQIDEELSEFDDYYDVYDIIPKNDEFYSNMEIFETSWDNSQYAIGNERELKWSAEEYAKQMIETEGINFFSKSFLENYTDLFIESKNSLLVLHNFKRSIKNSLAATSSIGCKIFLRIHIFCSSSALVINSSRRVPERLILIAGNKRFSAIRRSK
jgi:hypothetical protein